MQLDRWQMGRKPDQEDADYPGRFTKFSQTERLLNVTFIDMHGNQVNSKVEPGLNLAEAALMSGIDLDWLAGDLDKSSTWSHMIVSNPHFDALQPPCHREDYYLFQLEKHGTCHRNSRIVKFIPLTPELDGIVITHPFFADVVTPNFTDPFTGKLEDKDKALQPTNHVDRVLNPDTPDYKWPNPFELVWHGIDKYEDLWDYVRQGWLRRLAARKAASRQE